MPRYSRQKVLIVLAVLFAAGPFVAGMIRVVGAGDFRYLWTAVAAAFGTAVIMVLGMRRPGPELPVLRSGAAFLLSTALAGTMAYMLGATAAFGIWAVAFVYGSFFATAYHLLLLTAPRNT